MECKICKIEFKDIRGLSIHLVKKHKLNKEQIIEYYDSYLKKDNEDVCYFCGKKTKFKNMSIGYHKICDSNICLGKTRATGTYGFLMYKYGLSETDAKIEQQKRADNRGKKIKEKFDVLYKKDKNFHKKRSHQTKEFWINKGFTEEESILKVKDVTDMIHEKTWKKRRENPDMYDDVNTTQIKYWLKKGFTEEESIEKIKKRQSTFSLEKCIKNHGEYKGKEIWLKRQYKWHNNYKKSNFSKISQELFWLIYNRLNIIELKYIRFATLKDNKLDNSGNNNELRLQLDKIILPDFINIKSNKIIEFDGIYYHRNTIENKKREIIRNKILLDNGYEVLHVNESDYKKDKEKVIEECINFLKE